MKDQVKVKICGITNRNDLDAAVKMGVDAVGFVTRVTDSPRNLHETKVMELMKKTKNVNNVIVSVPRDTVELRNLYDSFEPDLLQVHGGQVIRELLENQPDLPRSAGRRD